MKDKSHDGQPQTLISLAAWTKEVGVTACTAWRWRKKGWLKTVNICGRQYLTHAAIAKFTARAERGDFAQEHKVPPREAGSSDESVCGRLPLL